MKRKPTFGSAFAGIGGFELGLERAGWECLWQIENDKFCNKVLEERWPDVKRYGGIEDVEIGELGAVDLVCGGFPCQDLSVAGKRKGLSGGRSGLFWELVRLVRGLRPRWILVENVPGFLSSNQGEDFALALETLAECGYGLAWRVLDSQHFGVPQRRRRVFIVGHLGAPCPPEILFEPEGGEGDTAEGGKAGEEVAGTLGGGSGKRGWCADTDRATFIARPLRAGRTIADSGGDQGNVIAYGSEDPSTAPTIRSPDPNAPRGPDGKRRDGGPGEKIPIIALESRIRGDDGRGYEREPRIRDDGIAWTIQAASPGNVCARAEGDPDGGGLRQPEDRGGRQADAGGEPDERQGDGGVPRVAGFSAGQSAGAGSIAYEEERSPTLRGQPSGTNQVPSVIALKGRPRIDSEDGGQDGDHPGQDVRGDNVGEEADPEGVREAPGVPGRVDLSVFQISHGGAREKGVAPPVLANEGPRRHGPGGWSSTDFTAVLVEEVEGLSVLGFRNLEAQREVVGTLMGHGDPSRKAGINDLPIVFDWRSGGDVRLNVGEEQASPLHSPQAPAVLTEREDPPVRDKAGTIASDDIRTGQQDENVVLGQFDAGFACPCPDSPRYRALGNAVTVQVVEWIGRRILGWHLANP